MLPYSTYNTNNTASIEVAAVEDILANGQFAKDITTPILNLWTECASSETPTDEEGQVMSLALDLLAVIFGNLTENIASEVLPGLLPMCKAHVMAHFPFHSIGKDSDRHALSVKACQILSHFLRVRNEDQSQIEIQWEENPWMADIYRYLLLCMKGRLLALI